MKAYTFGQLSGPTYKMIHPWSQMRTLLQKMRTWTTDGHASVNHSSEMRPKCVPLGRHQ